MSMNNKGKSMVLHPYPDSVTAVAVAGTFSRVFG